MTSVAIAINANILKMIKVFSKVVRRNHQFGFLKVKKRKKNYFTLKWITNSKYN